MYKNGIAAYGYCINHSIAPLTIKGGKTYDSHPLTASAFDAEAYGAMGITYALRKIIPQGEYDPDMDFTAVIDNQEVITTINECIIENKYLHPMIPFYEIFKQIQCNFEILGFHGIWEWIKTH